MSIANAFSREGDRLYVQDRVQEWEVEVVRLLERGGNVYVCGGAGMARGVASAVKRCFEGVRKWGDGQWEEWVERKRRSGGWREDVWG